MRRTSGCRMIGTVLPPATRSRPCRRSLEKASARWNARSAIATPSRPTAKRAAFIMMNMYSRPRFSSPTRWPTAWSYTITAVGLAWMPSLCSIEAHLALLRLPGLPSASGMNFGTTKSEIPFTPSGASGVRAHEGQVRPGLRLGEVHRPGPPAFDHSRQVGLLQSIGTAQQQGLDCALGEKRAERKAEVRALPHLLDRRRYQPGKPLPAPLVLEGQRVPSAVAELAVRVAKAPRGTHLAVAQFRAFLVS